MTKADCEREYRRAELIAKAGIGGDKEAHRGEMASMLWHAMALVERLHELEPSPESTALLAEWGGK